MDMLRNNARFPIFLVPDATPRPDLTQIEKGGVETPQAPRRTSGAGGLGVTSGPASCAWAVVSDLSARDALRGHEGLDRRESGRATNDDARLLLLRDLSAK